LQERLKINVCSSIRACPDTQRAAKVAEDMSDVAFARFRGVRPNKGEAGSKPQQGLLDVIDQLDLVLFVTSCMALLSPEYSLTIGQH
jgi:hypothetical protein